uniref:Uncharacterized protein n=1 Tax=Hyaloperonospora arabidopsidis (strain Emoy2) TaxID=559515 RepID=M4B373_HYAAE
MERRACPNPVRRAQTIPFWRQLLVIHRTIMACFDFLRAGPSGSAVEIQVIVLLFEARDLTPCVGPPRW